MNGVQDRRVRPLGHRIMLVDSYIAIIVLNTDDLKDINSTSDHNLGIRGRVLLNEEGHILFCQRAQRTCAPHDILGINEITLYG